MHHSPAHGIVHMVLVDWASVGGGWKFWLSFRMEGGAVAQAQVSWPSILVVVAFTWMPPEHVQPMDDTVESDGPGV